MSGRQLDARMNFVEEEDGTVVLYVEIRDRKRDPYRRIAKRYPKQNWINLEPGWTVRGSEPGAANGTICIEYDPPGQH
jgi:hypothetical protein